MTDPLATAPGGTIRVEHRGPLSGRIDVPGAKNSALKLMAASLLADGVYELANVPDLVDVSIMGDLLAAIGVTWERPGADRLVLTNSGRLVPIAPYELAERIRA